MATVLEQAIDWGTKLNPANNFVYYYFYGNGESTPFNEISHGFSNYEKGQFELAFQIYSSFLNLHFIEVNQSGAANLNLVTVSNVDYLGQMYPPGYTTKADFGYFNDTDPTWTQGLEQGGDGFITIIHELGHGLGLAHPHDHGGGSGVFPGVSSAFGDYGEYDLNQGIYTMMSYNDGWQTNPDGTSPSLQYGYEGTPMAVDIAVLQSKYGANMAYHTGDNTYFLPTSNGSGTFYSCIWDAGGTDTIAYTGNSPALIDLRAATLQVEPGGGGFLSYVDGIFGGYTIANGVTIENATGGNGDDFLRGNGVGNLLIGGKGDDIIRGASGKDTLKGGAGKDVIMGGRDGDLLSGGVGKDTLDGKSGNDTLYGDKGKDDLTGGPGHDAFVFAETIESAKADTITDFAPGKDAIWLSASIFTALGGLGTLGAGKFHIGSSAHNSSDRIIYNDATGALIYDKNGDQSGGAKHFATLDAGLALTHNDFIVVA
jgi:Ca2+-binding RTX toxin-like protein